MDRGTISYDINLVNSIYRSNNDALLRVAKKNLKKNKIEFDTYLENLVDSKGTKADDKLFNELSNIDWIFLNSIFLALYSNFENMIYKLATIVEDQSSDSRKIDHFKGNGYIDKYRKYMEVVGKLESAKKNDVWDEVFIYRLIRNKLAHEGGYFNRKLIPKLEEKKEFMFLINNKVLLAGKFRHIRLREAFFLEKFCDLTNQLLDRLVSDIVSSN